MTDDLDGINAQARDISFLITYAKSLPDTDLSQVAVVSWSWGGISSLVASARDPRIDALVSMDGSMRYYPGLVKRASNVHPERMAIPPRSAVIGGLAKDQFTKSSSTVARAGFILTRNA
jgi:dienelactone hydrolase